MTRSSVDLPPPLGPEQRGQRAVGDVERDVVECDEVAEALGELRTLMAIVRFPSSGDRGSVMAQDHRDGEQRQDAEAA